MKIAVVGCGYVTDSYAKTLADYPELDWSGPTTRMREILSRLVGVGRAWTRLRTAATRTYQERFTILRDYIQSSEGVRCWPSLNCTGHSQEARWHSDL
jgi:hypothetical protein